MRPRTSQLVIDENAMICCRDLSTLRPRKIEREHIAIAVGEALIGTTRRVDVCVEHALRQQPVTRPRITQVFERPFNVVNGEVEVGAR